MNICRWNFAERTRVSPDFSRYAEYGDAYISVVTASELLVGVHRAQDKSICSRHLAFVEGVLSALTALPVDIETARIHAQLAAQISRNETVGAHDAWIGATALRHGHAVLTNNGKDFRKLHGLVVVDYLIAPEG